MISTDITESDIRTIVSKSNKPLILNTFGYPMIMYSRRTLITNFYLHLNKEGKDKIFLNEKTTNSHFFASENKYGTAIFNSTPIDYRSIVDDELDANIKFYYINSSFCDKNIVKDIIGGKRSLGSRGFLDKKTIYRVGDIK